MYRPSEPGLGANEISRHLLTGVQVLRAPPIFKPTTTLNKETNEMSYLNTQALIESLMTLIKILARNPGLRLHPSIRAP
jgi:hypothetical protein